MYRFKRKTLLILLLSIFAYSVDYWLYNYFSPRDKEPSGAFLSGSEALCHWIISQAYITVGFQTTQMLDPSVYFDDPEKLAKTRCFRNSMIIANVAAVALIITASILI
jgi:hypothetical protein